MIRPPAPKSTAKHPTPQGGHNRDRARARLAIGALVFGIVYAVIGVRLASFAFEADPIQRMARAGDITIKAARPDITDRNGELLATDLISASLYAEPRKILDADEAVELITAVMPDLNADRLRKRLTADRAFIWLKRELTPRQQAEIHGLGLPGVGFRRENRRVYPSGPTVSHVVGHVNVDNRGIAGIEKYLDDRGLMDLHGMGFALDRAQKPVALSIDMRAQHALRDELHMAMERHKAKAAAGVVLDVKTGEVVAMTSLPDYNPNQPKTALDPEAINRMTTGVYEMGSTFKAFTVAMALDTGRISMNDRYDARKPLRVARHTINDFHAQRRILTVPEIFKHSSNIGTARMALDVGIEGQKSFLRRLGLLDRLETELPEAADPMYPRDWRQINAMTISFGHGISVAPLQMAAAAGALVNGGTYIPPTFLPRTETEAEQMGVQVLEESTSDAMRYLMRLNVDDGTAGKADRPGYRVGGKTGTAEKVVNGRYSKKKLLTSFLGTFPSDDPRFVVLIMLDEPKGTKETHGFATSGWNAAPTAGYVIGRIAPILGVMPKHENRERKPDALYISY
ncbi:MAG: penicillin-binding protein 2 [Pseudomonadota bacterium]